MQSIQNTSPQTDTFFPQSSFRLDLLQYYINQIIQKCSDIYSNSFKNTISSFQQFVSAEYRLWLQRNESGYFLQELFFAVSFQKLNQNTLHYLLINSALLKVEIGNKTQKAVRISRDLGSIKPTSNSIVWKLFEEILIWISNPLGTSLHLTLQPLRDLVWKWFFLQDTESILSSLLLVDLFFRKFPSSLNANYESVQSLLLRALQYNNKNIQKYAAKALSSSLNLLNSPYSSHIQNIFKAIFHFITAKDTLKSPGYIRAISSIFKKNPNYCSIFQFTDPFINRLSIEDNIEIHSIYALLPLIYRCSSKIFSNKHITALLEIFGMLIFNSPPQINQIFKYFGELFFLFNNDLIIHFQKLMDRHLKSLGKKLNTQEAAYVYLSAISPESEGYHDSIHSIFSLSPSSLISKGLGLFCKKWPEESHFIRKMVLNLHNFSLLSRENKESLILSLKTLTIFQFLSSEISIDLIIQYSLPLKHEIYQIRLYTAQFLLSQQINFPEIKQRLLSFVSTEPFEDLRLLILKQIIPFNSDLSLIGPLYSLLHDSQPELRYEALKLLSKIEHSKSVIVNYISELVQCLSHSNSHDKRFIKSLLIAAESCPTLLTPFKHFLINLLLKSQIQRSASLQLLSHLVSGSNLDDLLPQIVPHLVSNLSLHSSSTRISASLDLLKVTLQYSHLRNELTSKYSNLLLKILKISNGIEIKEMRNKLFDILISIGIINKHTIHNLFHSEKKTKSSLLGVSLLPDISLNDFIDWLLNSALSQSLSLLIDILCDKGLSTLHAQAIESILTVLKNNRNISTSIEEIIVEKVNQALVSRDTSVVSVILHNISALITVFGDSFAPMIPNVVELVREFWGKLDTSLLLRAIEWMGYRIPNVFSDYIFVITTMLISSLPLVSIKVADDIFSTFVSLGSLIQSVDYLVIPSILIWLQAHVDDHSTSDQVLEKLKTILIICGVEKFCGEVIRTLLVLVQQNNLLIERSYQILLLFAVKLNSRFLLYIPEIIPTFSLSQNTSFHLAIKSISRGVEIPQYITDSYKSHVSDQKNSSTSKKNSERQYQKDSPPFKVPPHDWDAAEWSHWADEFIPAFLLNSPSRSISACYALSERNVNVRSSLFPISFALSYATSKDIEKNFHLLSSAISSEKVPESLLKMFLNAVDLLEIYGIELKISDELLSNKAFVCGEYALALRINERIFRNNPQLASEKLVILNQKLGLNYAANGIFKCSGFSSDDKSHWNLAMKLGFWKEALESYEKQLLVYPNNIELHEGRLQCLNGLNKFRELLLESKIYNNNKFLLKSAWRICDLTCLSSELLSNINYDDHELILISSLLKLESGIISNEIHDPFILFNNIKSDLEARVLATVSSDYDQTFPDFAFSSLLSNYFDVLTIKKMQNQLPTSSPEDFSNLNNQINDIKSTWKVKFRQLYDEPLLMYDSIRIKSLILSSEELVSYWLDFIHYSRGSEFVQLREIAFNQIVQFNDPEIDFAFCEICRMDGKNEESTKNLIKLISKLDLDSPQIQIWQPILGKWLLEDGKIEQAAIAIELAAEICYSQPDSWLQLSKIHLLISNDENGLFQSLDAALKGLKLKPKNHHTFTQRIISIILKNGNSSLYSLFLDSLNEIPSYVWIGLLPQIIARLGNEDNELSEVMKLLILKIGEEHPHTVLFSLMVHFRSENYQRQSISTLLIEQLQMKFPELTKQIDIVSCEMIRLALSWIEKWYSSIDEASRCFANDGNKEKTIELLLPLHIYVERKPETLLEDQFLSKFGMELINAKNYLDKYIETNEITYFNQAWLIYVSAFKRMRPIISSLNEVSMQEASPILANLNDTKLVVPGTYRYDRSLVYLHSFGKIIPILKSKQRPRKLIIIGSDGIKYVFLLKANEDTRLDERVMQLFSFINSTIKQSNLPLYHEMNITTYKVVPITGKVGLIGWVPDCQTLLDIVLKYRNDNQIAPLCESNFVLKNYPNFDNLRGKERFDAFIEGFSTSKGNEIEIFLLRKSSNSQNWINRRINFETSLASNSMAGYILGLGDRHLANIMISNNNAKLIHIDFGDCFEVAMYRENYPEKVPFRLTRLLINALGVTKTEGTFRSCCENVIKLMRENDEQIMELLEAFIYDPLMQWTQPHNLKDQRPEIEIIQRIKSKLIGEDFDSKIPLNIKDQVQKLIEKATDEYNLSQMYRGWYPWW